MVYVLFCAFLICFTSSYLLEQDLTKNDKNPKNYVKQQPRYRPPGMNGPRKYMHLLPYLCIFDFIKSLAVMYRYAVSC